MLFDTNHGGNNPMLLRILGHRENLDALVAQAAGPDNLPAVDFIKWATGLEQKVRGGLDPITIEAGVADVLRQAGCENPMLAMAGTMARVQHRQMEFFRRMPESQSLVFPRYVVDPDLQPAERCANFFAMLAECRDPDVHIQDGAAPKETAFSLVALVPLPPAELVPDFAGLDHPDRDGAKNRAWSARSGLHDCKITQVGDNELMVVGWADTLLNVDAPPVEALCHISKAFDVKIEATGWGTLQRFEAGTRSMQKESLGSYFVERCSEKFGVRSPEALVELLSLGRHKQAELALLEVRAGVLKPGIDEHLARSAVSGLSAALLLKRRFSQFNRSSANRFQETASTDELDAGPKP